MSCNSIIAFAGDSATFQGTQILANLTALQSDVHALSDANASKALSLLSQLGAVDKQVRSQCL